jgi:hypothetical protein
MAYEVLPLFLIPQTVRRMAVLVVLSQAAFAIAVSLPGIDPARDLAGTLARQWPVWLVACYLPALAFVLRAPSAARPGPVADVESRASAVPSAA